MDTENSCSKKCSDPFSGIQMLFYAYSNVTTRVSFNTGQF